MATFEVRAVFSYGDRHWENVWEVDVGTAADVPDTVITAFKTFHLDTLLSTYILDKIVRRPSGSHDEFIEVLYGLPGNRDVGASEPLPLFNTILVYLAPFAGRPGLKYLRGFLVNTDLVGLGGAIADAARATVEGRMIDLLAAVLAASCFIAVAADKQVTASSIKETTQMRQLHRKRKKPVL